MGNGISSIVFFCRGTDKVANGEGARIVPTVAQGANTIQAAAKADVVGSKTACAFVNTIDDAAKTDSIWGKGAKALKWSQNHVNPLIGLCAGTKIVTSDDKQKAFCTEVPGFLGMLAAEGKFKQIQKTETAKNIVKNITEFGGKKGKFLAALTEGALFAATSIGGYMAASKVGEYAIEGERAIKARKIAEMA